MNDTYNPNLKPFSQKLRKEMTKEERHLWYDFLKALPVTVNRQKIIGKYIVDFYCASSKCVIEIDGTQHFQKDGIHTDKQRDAFFSELGIRVLIYSNYDINNSFDAVCEDILNNLKKGFPLRKY